MLLKAELVFSLFRVRCCDEMRAVDPIHLELVPGARLQSDGDSRGPCRPRPDYDQTTIGLSIFCSASITHGAPIAVAGGNDAESCTPV